MAAELPMCPSAIRQLIRTIEWRRWGYATEQKGQRVTTKALLLVGLGSRS